MSTIFTIGEIAKLFNISTQALRLYDRIDLLKPAYINEETGYRYYSIGQFVNLECIKRCKAMGEKYEMLKHDLSFAISYEDILKENKVIYKFLSVEIDENEKNAQHKKVIKLPAGKYVTMYFDDRSIDNRKYYRKIIDFISENNIEVVGDFLETAMILRVNKDGKENTLAKLEILCKWKIHSEKSHLVF